MKGYAGQLLYVHLDSGNIEKLPLYPESGKKFLGGYGIGAKFLYQNMPAHTDAFDTKSIIGFVSGPLCNTSALFGGRYTVVCKSPVTGGWNDANSGGTFGGKLKKSGYDAIFVTGISEKPVYLFVNNGKAEILDAGDLWGLTIKAAEEKLQKRHGKKAGIALIGPGGENLSLFAAVMNDGHRAAARGGPGAVMGSKNLKAIVVKGCKHTWSANPLAVIIHDIESLIEMLKVVSKSKAKIKEGEDEEDANAYFPQLGTGGSYAYSVALSDAGIRNFTAPPPKKPEKVQNSAEPVYTYEDAEELSSQKLNKFKKKRYHCTHCNIGCSMLMEVPTKRWGKLETTRPEYETMGAFGSMLLNNDVESVVMANDLCNEYGFDTISAGGVVAWAMECYSNGILSQDELDGIDLKWGNGDAVVQLMEKICKNEGIGKILAQGSRKAAELLGKGEECLVTANGIEQPQHDARFRVGLGRTYLADPTPGRHVKASLNTTSLDTGFDQIESLKGTGPEDVLAVIQTEIMNASGSCAFGFGYANPRDAVIRNIIAVTGNTYNHDDITRLGIRLFTMRQVFNIREGILRDSLNMSERMSKGKPPYEPPLDEIDLDFNVPVDSLYAALGWTRDGVPTKTALSALGGFRDVIKDLYGESNPVKIRSGEKNARPPSYFTGKNK